MISSTASHLIISIIELRCSPLHALRSRARQRRFFSLPDFSTYTIYIYILTYIYTYIHISSIAPKTNKKKPTARCVIYRCVTIALALSHHYSYIHHGSSTFIYLLRLLTIIHTNVVRCAGSTSRSDISFQEKLCRRYYTHCNWEINYILYVTARTCCLK